MIRQFAIDPQFAGHSLQLALTAFYDEAGVAYATTFYNETVPVLDPKIVFDHELAVIYLTLAASRFANPGGYEVVRFGSSRAIHR